MKSNGVLTGLMLVNLGLLILQFGRLGAAEVKQTNLPILRGSGIEIVDGQGRLRAELKLLPEDRSVTMPNGKTEPETMIFRLITSDGKPRVKLSTSDQGSGLSLVGDSDSTYVILEADLERSSLKLRNNAETEKLIKP